MMVALAALVPLILLTALARLGRNIWRARQGLDLAGILLTVVCRYLPADRAQWGAAMRTELACIDNAAQRRGFAFGAIRATVTARLMGRRQRRTSVLVLAAVTICSGLTAAVLISYPGLRSLPHVPLVIAVLAITLGAYTAMLVGTSGVAVVAPPAMIRWCSIFAGGATTATWFVFITAWWDLHGAPLAAAVLLPILAGAITARTTGSIRTAVTMATRTGLIAGIGVFITVTIYALATVPGTNSDVRTAAMGEGLAMSALLLLLVPCLTVVAGTAGAVIGISRRNR